MKRFRAITRVIVTSCRDIDHRVTVQHVRAGRKDSARDYVHTATACVTIEKFPGRIANSRHETCARCIWIDIPRGACSHASPIPIPFVRSSALKTDRTGARCIMYAPARYFVICRWQVSLKRAVLEINFRPAIKKSAARAPRNERIPRAGVPIPDALMTHRINDRRSAWLIIIKNDV